MCEGYLHVRVRAHVRACKCVSYHTDGTLCLQHDDQHLMTFRDVFTVCNRKYAKQIHRVSKVQFLSFKVDAVCN